MLTDFHWRANQSFALWEQRISSKAWALSVVPHFFSLPTACRLFTHSRSRFARSTIPEEKWGTTRSRKIAWIFFLICRDSKKYVEFSFYSKPRGQHESLFRSCNSSLTFMMMDLLCEDKSKFEGMSTKCYEITQMFFSKACKQVPVVNKVKKKRRKRRKRNKKWSSLQDNFASQIGFLVPRRPRPCSMFAEASFAWQSAAKGKQTAENQGQLQASANPLEVEN